MYEAMDPEFREMPPEVPAEDPSYYGTGRQPRAPRSHMPLTLLLLTILLLANTTALLLVSRLQQRRQTSDETRQPTDALLSANAPDRNGEADAPVVDSGSFLTLKKAGDDSLSLSEIYEKALPSLAVVTTDSGGGTALILTADGYLLTNAETVKNARSLTATLSDGAQYEAQTIGTDEVTDLAVLKIDATGLTAAEFADSDSVRTGDTVAAVSNPLGGEFGSSISTGYISSADTTLSIGGRELGVLQTNASLNATGAGGPLYNRSGQVVGFNIAHISGYVSYSTVPELGFALPIRTADILISDLIEYGYVRGRVDLGVTVEAVDPSQQRYWNLPEGVIIRSITTDSNAFAVGIRSGDVIMSLGGVVIRNEESYQTALNRCRVGQSVEIIIYRNGQKYSANVVLGQYMHGETA